KRRSRRAPPDRPPDQQRRRAAGDRLHPRGPAKPRPHGRDPLNLDGAIHLISGFLPGLKRAARASIVIVSSGYGLAPSTRAPIYSASKAALHSLSKSLRRQLAPLNISVTEVAPPVVDTPAVVHRDVAKMSAKVVAEQTLAA